MGEIRLTSHNQWKCDSNRPEWELLGMDCSAKTEPVVLYSPEYYLPLSDHSPVFVDVEL